MKLFIKQSDINDLDVLRDIAVTTFKDTFAAVNTADDLNEYIEKSLSHKQIERELLNAHSTFYLAYWENKLVGYLKVNLTPAQTDINDKESLELERIYILKQFQGRGFGPQLLEKAIRIANEHNLKYIWLGVWEKNARAIHVYEKRGFVKFKAHTFWLGKDKQTDDLMRLELT
ncbi:GNAT family N-acetyltransferase [Fulvivirgaceae bacterium BMA12]|uniref:GNAT family N-acetyltransferase n=1 Tax=Agaribacillus aureus TaxID=3051825 RepID=A0ABT8L4G1_9BACT|nr:GNAT family N-acetyltransferase [Fulvivirgaceae bacterium BMA12]